MITKEDIKKIADLAMLEIERENIEKFAEQFGEILDYMEEINGLDLSNQEAAFHITEMSNVFRDDTIKESLDNKTAIKNAPEPSDGFFKVPRVI